MRFEDAPPQRRPVWAQNHSPTSARSARTCFEWWSTTPAIPTRTTIAKQTKESRCRRHTAATDTGYDADQGSGAALPKLGGCRAGIRPSIH